MQIYKDKSRSPEERADDLLSIMTLEEKLAQMKLFKNVDREFDEKTFMEKYPYGVGGTYETDSLDFVSINKMQKFILEKTRLGIPVLLMGESLHGFKCDGATVFPQAIGLGSTFDPELIREMADIIGTEMYACGVRVSYAPNLDISRDPRWGRVEETYGEDPYLTTRFGLEYVKALQAHDVAACPKHFASHGVPEGGLNLGSVHLGERELREVMLPAFEAAFKEGKAMVAMTAYHDLDGIPATASHFLLTDILRGEFGFEGFVISDFGSVSMLKTLHHIAADNLDAGIKALSAGMDMEAPIDVGFGKEFLMAVKEGKIDIKLIDKAVKRILTCKFKLGLFDNPYAMTNPSKVLRSDRAIKLAQKAAEESVVLLRNKDNLLPLDKNIGKVALIGPSAKTVQLGDYTARSAFDNAVAIYDALTERLGEERVNYAKGCAIAHGNDEEIEEAVRAAKESDVAILALGDNSSYFAGMFWGDENETGHAAVTCGEGFDMCSLDLPGRQQELLEKVHATGTPVVLLLMTGRPYAITWASQNIPAIMQVWYPGEQGGHALANLLFGDVNPSGKLSISFPRSVGHIPCYYNHRNSARGIYHKPGTPETPGWDYVFDTTAPLYPFGYGLSYTTFEYSDLQVTPDKISQDETVEVSVTVKNTGTRQGCETVMLFLSDIAASVAPYVKRLRGFKRVTLAPGESQKVNFTLGREDFYIINEKMKPEVEPGEFRVSIGGLNAVFNVIKN